MITVYILNCADGTQYTGITQSLPLRIKQHKNGLASYTHKRLPIEVALSFEVANRSLAARIEKHIKNVGATNFMLKNCDLLLFVKFNSYHVINASISKTSLEYICLRFALQNNNSKFVPPVETEASNAGTQLVRD